MLPADLDDEQRANLAHEHPTDLDSSPSSTSSGIPSFFNVKHRSKSTSRHRSRTTTDESSNSHLLARLVSREEEVREINAALVVTSERLETESSRANAAERRALDYFHRLRIATENRERADQESTRLREELKLYKLQLENAQKEIFRAQDIIDQVASQRNEAEADAARARTKARKLQEEKLVMLAREEGRRMGYKEGLSIGRRIGYDEEDHERDESVTDEEPSDPRSRIQLRSAMSIREHPMRSESAPPVRTFETDPHAPPLPVLSRKSSVRMHTPRSHEHRVRSPPHDTDEPETIHPIPIPIHSSPILPAHHINVPHPSDGWIPTADSRTSYIPVPPPHELRQRVPTSPTSVATEIQDSRLAHQEESTPVPPPVRTRDYAYQASVPAPIPVGRTSSLASRTSTHISQYDLVNKRPGSSLRNEIYAGRARSGSQPSRDSMSRNSHRDQERRFSDRTEADSIIEQWRADSDVASPPMDPPRSVTPAARAHPPPHFYYRPREIVTPTPLGDVGADPRARTPVPTESTAVHPQSPPDDFPASHPARARSPLEYLRQRFRQRPSSGSSIPNIVVESPSEPETTMSPSATIAGQPELLSPEAANRPLPQDGSHQHQHEREHEHEHEEHEHEHGHGHEHQHQHHRHQHHHHRPAASTYDTATRSGTPSAPWPVGFVPYPSGQGQGTASKPGPGPGSSERDRRRARPDLTPTPTPAPAPTSDPNRSQHGRTHVHPPNGYTRTRTQSASMYEAAPLPPGVMYPAPPVRPQTSHRRYKDRDRERDWEREREREREGQGERERERVRDTGRDRDWGRELERDRDRDRDVERERVRDRDRDRDRDRRRDSGRDHERERDRDRDRDREPDPEDTGLDEELTRSPAPLQRPISLFDSDEA